jgi:predicted nucleotidyltransferase
MSNASFGSIREVLSRHPGVRLAIVFGSVASASATRDSDLDLAVAADRPLTADDKLNLIADLAEATGRPVDLIDLNTVGGPLLGQILTHGKRLLGSDERYAGLLARHLIDEADFMPYYRRVLAERRQAWIGR